MSEHLPEESSPDVQTIVPGLTLEWLYGGQIAILTLTSLAFEAIDAWVETAVGIVKSRPPGQPHLVIHDFSSDNLSLTTYLRRRMQDAASAVPEAAGRVAVLVPGGLTGVMARLLVNNLMPLLTGRPLRAFASREEALAWLVEMIDRPAA